MMDQPSSAQAPPDHGPDDRLDSWKEIAGYLRRDVTTVQRWEKREGMPVHRHLHGRLGSVSASRAELDAWSRGRTLTITGETPPATPGRADSVAVVRRRMAVPLAVVAIVVLVGVASWALSRRPSEWRNPLAAAQFRRLTDFASNEFAASISRDGRFVAFLSDRDGPTDAWVTTVGTGQFQNVTGGRLPELVNPSVRTIRFSADGSFVSLWVRRPGAGGPDDIGLWSVPTWAREPRPYLKGIAEADWSSDGTRLVYHTPGPGDPMFVRTLADGIDRPVFKAAAGLHAHFPTWSPDDRFIYFVQGTLPDAMDLWRIAADGGPAERLTFHNARVTYPAFLDARTVAYLATDQDGAGPWLYGLDLERLTTHRLTVGPEQYTSIAASGDGRKLVVTVARPRGTLWRVPLSSGVAEPSVMQRIEVPTGTAMSPRLGGGSLLFVSSRDGSDTIERLAGGDATEIWTAPGARITGAPAIAPDGQRVAFTAAIGEHAQLYVMSLDGSAVRPLTSVRAPRGAPSWSPDGQSLVVAQTIDGVPRAVRVDVNGSSVVPLGEEYALDPIWSPDGRFIVYSGADVGTTFPVRSIPRDGGSPRAVDLMLTRGGRRLQFLPGSRTLVLLRGEIAHKNLWLHDLDTGAERQLTDFGSDVTVRDFDVSADAREIVFDQVHDNSDLVWIDVPPRP
jgi:Tol biopolymer transport system component